MSETPCPQCDPTSVRAELRQLARLVLAGPPAHVVANGPGAARLAHRIGECNTVRDCFAGFAHTEAGARRVLSLSLALARTQGRQGRSGAACLAVAAWCAAALDRWSLASALAERACEAVESYRLAELILEAANTPHVTAMGVRVSSAGVHVLVWPSA
jgi:hypothetical protein